ncbi:MAG: 2-hydroxyacyl-CoA dehydratase [Chloroflexi bacterium]|nr:2-hydroxyacyl-CoA dehydratase [Chloroflexota bacterium]
MTTQVSSKSGLAKLKELYQDRQLRVRELKQQGVKVVGYFCCYPPLELITAANLLPYRIQGDVREPITQADAYLETIMCPFVRSTFDLALKGRYDFLDGMVMPHSCDTVERLYNVWRFYHKPDYMYSINVPHMLHHGSGEFFKHEIQTFKKSLEEFTGQEITQEKLRQAVELHNRNRRLLRQLYQLRKSSPPLLSGTEVMEIVVAGMTIPAAEFGDLLEAAIAEIQQRNQGPQPGARVMIYGSEIDDIAFVELVESCGANVVMDDLCTGTRQFWVDVEPTPDPLDGITKRYLTRVVCPRTYKNRKPTRQEDFESRFSYLKQYAQEFNVAGVILYIIRYCDTHELDVPSIRNYLEAAGYSVLHLEDDYSVTTIGQLRTRVQAFTEVIG